MMKRKDVKGGKISVVVAMKIRANVMRVRDYEYR